ncbi:MAG: outer membrane beta-barrel family protein [Saprospiraceae bacterium]
MRLVLVFIFVGCFLILSGQPNQRPPQVRVTGTVIDKVSGQPLEFATVSFQHIRRTDILNGGLTDEKGMFDLELQGGKYNIQIEYLSYGTIEIKNKDLLETQDLGILKLAPNDVLLEELTIRADRTTVEMKLDKRVYNLGQDLMVKGGTASDVLDNVPSVAVDAEGNVTLRGNENVRILIDGRPSNAINITDALKMIPAESLEKIEVITNPSARYDAEGSSGIINIVLKKGKERGLNAILTGTIGYPENTTVTGNLNYKIKKFNVFTSQGFRKNSSPGSFYNESRFLIPNTEETKNYVIEDRSIERNNLGYNGNIGLDYFIGPKTTWTNMFLYRNTDENDLTTTQLDFFDQYKSYQNSTFRYNDGTGTDESLEFSSNFKHDFKKEDHKITFDVSISKSLEDELIAIQDITEERNGINTEQFNQLYQLDYVLPINKNTRIEAGYRGNFTVSQRDFIYEKFIDNSWVNQGDFSNVFEYKEFVNAAYTQFGSKINKFNYLLGLRWEDSDIHVNQFTANDFNNKKYSNFFPSAFLNYEFSETFGMSLSYSKRIQRPRGRFLNPYSEIGSSLNIFKGNPDIDPVFSNAFDFGILKRWEKVTLNASTYYNVSKDAFQFVRRESELLAPGDVPVIFSGPINAGEETRFGFEFTINYNPIKAWRINANFNLFNQQNSGEFKYVGSSGEEKVISLENESIGWFARINSKYTLPLKIDWQINFSYNAPQKTAQGKSIGLPTLNTAFSKDIWKDKATINLNVNDIFNTRRRIFEANIPGVMYSYSDMQWRQRQITLGFTYRFNRKKSDREQTQKPREENDGMM